MRNQNLLHILIYQLSIYKVIIYKVYLNRRGSFTLSHCPKISLLNHCQKSINQFNINMSYPIDELIERFSVLVNGLQET